MQACWVLSSEYAATALGEAKITARNRRRSDKEVASMRLKLSRGLLKEIRRGRVSFKVSPQSLSLMVTRDIPSQMKEWKASTSQRVTKLGKIMLRARNTR